MTKFEKKLRKRGICRKKECKNGDFVEVKISEKNVVICQCCTEKGGNMGYPRMMPKEFKIPLTEELINKSMKLEDAGIFKPCPLEHPEKCLGGIDKIFRIKKTNVIVCMNCQKVVPSKKVPNIECLGEIEISPYPGSLINEVKA